MIKIRYRSIDGCAETRTFKTIKGARAYAHNLLGPHPDIGSFYAVSDDGIGRVTCSGVTLAELFPAPADAPPPGAQILQDEDAY